MWWRGEGRGGEEANRVIALSRDGADSEGSSARGWHVISQFRSSASQGPGHTSLPFLILCGPYAQLLFSILLQLHSLPERQTLGHLQQMSKWCTGHVTREEYITGTKDKKKAKKSKALKKKKNHSQHTGNGFRTISTQNSTLPPQGPQALLKGQ